MAGSDAVLWEQWRAGRDPDAFAELVARHAGMVHAACRRILGNAADAEEVAQECFLALVDARVRVRESLAPWLHTVANRRSRDRLKEDRRRRQRERRPVERSGGAGGPETREILELVDAAIAELPAKLRLPVLMRYLEGNTQADVARRLGVPESTIAHRLKRAVEEIRAFLRRRGLRITAGALTAFLAEEMCESAPATLTAALGKIAIASPRGAGAGAFGSSSSSSIGKIVAASVAAVGILGVSGFLAFRGAGGPPIDREPAGSPSAPSGREEAAAPPPIRAGREHAVDSARKDDSEPASSTGVPLDILCVDAEGAPVTGAEVLAVEYGSRDRADRDESDGYGPFVTDRSGRARFTLPSRDGTRRLGVFAKRNGTLAGFDSRILEPPGEAETVEIVLSECRELAGFVVVPPEYDPRAVTVRVLSLHIGAGGTSRDLSGPDLECGGPGATYRPWREVFSRRPDGGGGFRFASLPAASRIDVVADGSGLGRERTTVKSPWPVDPVILNLLPEGIIEGTVTYEDTGEAAEGIPLEAESSDGELHETVVDATAHFRFSALSEGFYHISLAGGFDPGEWRMPVRSFVRVSSGTLTGDIHLELQRGVLVTGRVADAATGAPIRIGLCAVNGKEGGSRTVGYARTDADGSYAMRLPRGSSKVYICERRPEYIYSKEDVEKVIVIAEGDERRDGIDFALMPRVDPASPSFGFARGRVVDPDGHPLAGVHVRTFVLHDAKASHPSFIFDRRTATDESGRYELIVASGPKVYIEAGGGEYSTGRAIPFEVEGEGLHEVEDLIVRLGEAFLAGRVVDGEGEPLSGVSVYGARA